MNEEQPATSNQQPLTDRRTFIKGSLAKTVLAANAAAFAGLINTPGVANADPVPPGGYPGSPTGGGGSGTTTLPQTTQPGSSLPIQGPAPKFKLVRQIAAGESGTDAQLWALHPETELAIQMTAAEIANPNNHGLVVAPSPGNLVQWDPATGAFTLPNGGTVTKYP